MNIRIKDMSENVIQTAVGLVSYGRSEIAELVVKAISRDLEAFGDLYTVFLERIYRYVFYHVREKMTAQDITEEVFLKAWKSIDSCKGREQTFSSWLYRIAHNLVIDNHRSRQKRLSMEITMGSIAEIGDTNQEPEMNLEQQQLFEAMSSLTIPQKQVIILKFIEGMGNDEIAQIMGKSQGSIRILQMRALSALRRLLYREKLGR